jgi:hypothetical protein
MCSVRACQALPGDDAEVRARETPPFLEIMAGTVDLNVCRGPARKHE